MLALNGVGLCLGVVRVAQTDGGQQIRCLNDSEVAGVGLPPPHKILPV